MHSITGAELTKLIDVQLVARDAGVRKITVPALNDGAY